jgi:hypothetical protein
MTGYLVYSELKKFTCCVTYYFLLVSNLQDTTAFSTKLRLFVSLFIFSLYQQMAV